MSDRATNDQVSLLVLGDHKEKSPLSETVLQAYELIWADEPS